MRVASYRRVSNDEQASRGYSLAAQKSAIEQYAKVRGWTIGKDYADLGVSAFNDDPAKRPAFAQLMAAVAERQYDVVIILKIDRFARSIIVASQQLAVMREHRCALVSITEQWDFSGAAGMMLYQIMAVFAEHESRQISERTKRGLAVRVAAGKHMGPVPWGGMLVDERLVVDPARAADLAWLLELLATGSFVRACHALNRRGLRTMRGNMFSPATVQMLLGSAGWLAAQPDPWPGLLALARRRRPASKVRNDRVAHPLSGIWRCVCGGKLYAAGTWRGANGVRQQSVRCTHYTPARPDGGGCPYPRTNARHYAERVRDWCAALPDPQVLAARTVPDETAETATRRADITRRKRLLGVALNDDTLDEASYRARLVALQSEEAALPVAVRVGPVIDAVALMRAGPDALDTPALNRLYRLLLDTVIVRGHAVTIVPSAALAVLLQAN